MEHKGVVPLYLQLKETFIKNIRSGEWPEKSKVLSEREICEKFGVSRITARNALEALEQEGYVVRKQGKGTFVKPKTLTSDLNSFYSLRSVFEKQGIHVEVKDVFFEVQSPSYEVADKLGISLEEKVYVIKRIFICDGELYAFEVSYVPHSVNPFLTLKTIREYGLYNALSKYGIVAAHAIEQIQAINLSQKDAAILDVGVGTAALNIARVTKAEEEIVEYSNCVVRGDVFSYKVELK